ncbi:hypothetical protein [Acinetobacter bereziniae]|nr:hypothetical protein [Acinetobacter bereziniae]
MLDRIKAWVGEIEAPVKSFTRILQSIFPIVLPSPIELLKAEK